MLTGSAVPVDVSLLKHSGTGQFAWLKMRPMTLVESGESSGAVSLKALFAGKHGIGCASNGSLEETAFCACRGGWPPASRLEPEYALDHAFNYVEAIIHADISRADNVKRNEETTRACYEPMPGIRERRFQRLNWRKTLKEAKAEA